MSISRPSGRSEGQLRVLSHSNEPFADREQAGQLLAEQLVHLKGRKTVILGIPRGGIVVAKELAQKIDADLDIVLARKLGTPGQEELAMGSLSEDGKIFLNPDVVQGMGIKESEIEQEKARQMVEIQRRSRLVRGLLPKTSLKNRVVVVTDDGVATGATMQAALWATRQEGPQRLIAAIPVASGDALERLSADADEIICLRQPSMFYAVGQFYMKFYQVGDEEVLSILTQELDRRRLRENSLEE